jgi:hypothetical protein
MLRQTTHNALTNSQNGLRHSIPRPNTFPPSNLFPHSKQLSQSHQHHNRQLRQRKEVTLHTTVQPAVLLVHMSHVTC